MNNMAESLYLQDEILIEEPKFEELWDRNMEESIRQGNEKPFIEEARMQVSDWGFTLSELQVQRRCQGRGILPWLRSMYSQAACELTGFLGPIHVWQVCAHLSGFGLFVYSYIVYVLHTTIFNT